MGGVVASFWNIGEVSPEQAFCRGRVGTPQHENDSAVEPESGIAKSSTVGFRKHQLEINGIFTIREEIGGFYVRLDRVGTLLQSGEVFDCGLPRFLFRG